MGVGRQGPAPGKTITLPDGAKMAIGKDVQYMHARQSHFQYNEYVVYKQDQVRPRYLIQLK